MRPAGWVFGLNLVLLSKKSSIADFVTSFLNSRSTQFVISHSSNTFLLESLIFMAAERDREIPSSEPVSTQMTADDVIIVIRN